MKIVASITLIIVATFLLTFSSLAPALASPTSFVFALFCAGFVFAGLALNASRWSGLKLKPSAA